MASLLCSLIQDLVEAYRRRERQLLSLPDELLLGVLACASPADLRRLERVSWKLRGLALDAWRDRPALSLCTFPQHQGQADPLRAQVDAPRALKNLAHHVVPKLRSSRKASVSLRLSLDHKLKDRPRLITGLQRVFRSVARNAELERFGLSVALEPESDMPHPSGYFIPVPECFFAQLPASKLTSLSFSGLKVGASSRQELAELFSRAQGLRHLRAENLGLSAAEARCLPRASLMTLSLKERKESETAAAKLFAALFLQGNSWPELTALRFLVQPSPMNFHLRAAVSKAPRLATLDARWQMVEPDTLADLPLQGLELQSRDAQLSLVLAEPRCALRASLTSLRLHCGGVRPESLRALLGLPRLRRLSLSALAEVRTLSGQRRRLDLEGFYEALLRRCRVLEDLRLRDCALPDGFLRSLPLLPSHSLRRLHLSGSGCEVSEEAVLRLAAGLSWGLGLWLDGPLDEAARAAAEAESNGRLSLHALSECGCAHEDFLM